MEKNPADDIVMTALLKRFKERRLPRLLDIEKRVNAGETLSDSDITFLETVFHDAQYILPLTDKYPEYHELVTKALQIYHDVAKKGLENEKKNQKKNK